MTGRFNVRCWVFIFLLGTFSGREACAQTGTSISADGALPNSNTMLDVQSPATGDGKGLLIPRISENQRTEANAGLEGGLLDDDGNLRGGPAQGLMVYQTDGAQGFYYNTSATATPVWQKVGTEGESTSATFGYFYNLTPDDFFDFITISVEPGDDFPFSNSGPQSGIAHTEGETTLTVSSAGTYKIDYSISFSDTTNITRLALAVNGVVDPSTSVPVRIDSGKVYATAILTLSAGDVITLRNNSSGSTISFFTAFNIQDVITQCTIVKLDE